MANKFEQLALWYLRLNGYLTVPHFILHGRSQRGEVDILGVRFPYSREVAGRKKMEPDSNLVRQHEKTDFIIAEVKSGECGLNVSWTDKDKGPENMGYMLRWLGMVPEAEVSNVARELYLRKRCEREKWVIRLVCFGSERSDDLPANVVQLTFKQVIEFMSDRFKQFRRIKQDREQWDPSIKELFDMMVTKRPNEILAWLRN